MSAPQFSVKRRFINGENDWRYQQTKAPVTTSGDQYIYGVKQFAEPIKALSDVLCSGFYYGDGSQLTNVTATDPSKLPLAGGTMTGPIHSDSNLDLTATYDVQLISDPNGNINLIAPNVNSYGYAMPICFDFHEIDRTYNYTPGGQTWEKIWQQDVFLPEPFFSFNPTSGYSSVKWRIDFTINTWSDGSGDNSSDKALAYYIMFEDQAATPYVPTIITSSNPFCRHNNNSTWSGGGPLTNFQPFSWTDIIDFGGLVGSGSNLLPLRFQVYFAADNPKNFNFSYKCGLTKTTRI